jgi:hypothetical protein
MAQSDKIDELFRAKLFDLEATPMVASWDQVQKQMTKKRTPWSWYAASIAAAVTLILVSIVLLFPSQKKSTYISGQVDHPVLMNRIYPATPVRIDTEVAHAVIQPKKAVLKYKTKPAIIENHEEQLVEITISEEIAPISVAAISDLTEEVIETNITLLEAPTTDVIKITYIANESKDENEEKNRLNKMLTAAQKLSPAEVLADLRDAKNHLLSRN